MNWERRRYLELQQNRAFQHSTLEAVEGAYPFSLSRFCVAGYAMSKQLGIGRELLTLMRRLHGGAALPFRFHN